MLNLSCSRHLVVICLVCCVAAGGMSWAEPLTPSQAAERAFELFGIAAASSSIHMEQPPHSGAYYEMWLGDQADVQIAVEGGSLVGYMSLVEPEADEWAIDEQQAVLAVEDFITGKEVVIPAGFTMQPVQRQGVDGGRKQFEIRYRGSIGTVQLPGLVDLLVSGVTGEVVYLNVVPVALDIDVGPPYADQAAARMAAAQAVATNLPEGAVVSGGDSKLLVAYWPYEGGEQQRLIMGVGVTAVLPPEYSPAHVETTEQFDVWLDGRTGEVLAVPEMLGAGKAGTSVQRRTSAGTGSRPSGIRANLSSSRPPAITRRAAAGVPKPASSADPPRFYRDRAQSLVSLSWMARRDATAPVGR